MKCGLPSESWSGETPGEPTCQHHGEDDDEDVNDILMILMIFCRKGWILTRRDPRGGTCQHGGEDVDDFDLDDDIDDYTDVNDDIE